MQQKSTDSPRSRYKGRGKIGKEVAKPPKEPTRMEKIFGFDVSDFSSWTSFIKLMNRPMDPASLGVTRMVFGLLMTLDALQERGMGYADHRWGDPTECRFPLFDFLAPLSLSWMLVVYFIMAMGAIGIMLGLFSRLSALMFCIPYWYIFMLDKTHWNNHSYLFGLVGTMMLFMDTNRYGSLDGLRNPKIRNAHVPLWNYTLLRTQFFLVYFLAGLKKLDMDWMTGQSMNNLSRHWVFMPFKLVLTDEMIDLYIVHIGGLTYDLFIGYALFFDWTRPLGIMFGLMFNGMNSQIFNIGMFPWTMMATIPLFCYVDWPRRFVYYCPRFLQKTLPILEEPQYSEHCIYPKEVVKPEEKSQKDGDGAPPKSRVTPKSKAGRYHNIAVIGLMTYLSWQVFMPYSHFITQGYNNWTNGLYGYSWDMMVHSWNTQHTRITYRVKETGKTGYLNPQAFCESRRWHSHSDMLKQHAACVERILADEHNLTGIELYYDIWRSLNDRFQQRQFDPRVDILTAEWSAYKKTDWLFPLLTGLSDWRGKLSEIEKSIYNSSNDTDVVFIADFPGLSLENYIQPELGNTTLQVMKGQVIVEMLGHETQRRPTNKNITVSEGETLQVPAGEYHNVHTVTDQPSCYMYIYTNTTDMALQKKMTLYEEQLKEAEASGGNITALNETFADVLPAYNDMRVEVDRIKQKANATLFERFQNFALNKYRMLHRGVVMTKIAFQSILTGQTFGEVFNSTVSEYSKAVDFGHVAPTDDSASDTSND